MCKGYYSPKIKDDYIPFLYYLARFLGMPMTELVNKIVGDVVKPLMDKEELLAEFAAIQAEDERFAEITAYLNSLIHSRSRGRKVRSKIIKMFQAMKRHAKNGGNHDRIQRKG